MVGITPVSGDLSMEDLAATLTSDEQMGFQEVTGLAIDPAAPRNLVTTISQPNAPGPLAIVARGADSAGTKFLSPTVYISGTKTDVDVYRLPLA
jgi:hypothetical protein